jgi:Family of unknown function (DUF5670)
LHQAPRNVGLAKYISNFITLTERYSVQGVYGYHALFVKAVVMIWTIVVILFVLWLLGFAVFHVAGGLIHILLVLAVIAIVYQLITGRRVV